MNLIHLLYSVKYLFLAQAIVCTFLFTSASAQNENWDTYMAKLGDKPGSVLVDLGLYETAPEKLYPNLVITGPEVQNCDGYGLPGKEEIDVLEEILDATGNFLTGVTPKVLAGTLTYNCQRVNYYYVKDTTGIRNAIARLYNRSYKNYSYALTIKPDPDWKTYLTFLYPDEATRLWMENDKIIAKMMERGDSLSKPRNIDFDLYFKTDTDRKAMVAYAKSKGYKADISVISKSATAPFEVIVSKYGPIKMDAINEMAADLKREIRKHSGLYNGWEAPPEGENQKK